MTTITVDEFKRRVKENTAEALKQKDNNSFDLKKFNGFDALAGTKGRAALSKKANDILDAIGLGMLPVLNDTTGVDAFRLNDNETGFIPVELKSTYSDESKFVRTKKGAIYSATSDKIIDNVVDQKNTTLLKSTFNATYKIQNNLNSKNLEMYLTVRDSFNDSVIDIIKVDASVIFEHLTDREIPKSGSIQVKYTTCEKLGTRVTSSIFPIKGLDNWKKELLPRLPLVYVRPTPKKKKGSSQDLDLPDDSKIDPTQETSSPCIQVSDQSEILNQPV